MKQQTHGIASLEAAIFLLVIVGVVTAGLGVLDFVSKSIEIRRLVERVARDGRVAALSLRSNDQGVHTEINASALDKFIAEKAVQGETELTAGLGSDVPHTSDRYQIRTQYQVLDIDPTVGTSRGILSSPRGASVQGSYAASGAGFKCGSLEPLFASVAQQIRKDPENHEISSFAVTDGQGRKFLDRAVLVGMSVALNLESTPINSLFPSLSHVEDCTVALIRMEVQ